MSHAFEDRARHLCIAQFLEQFVGDVGRCEVGEDEHVGWSNELHERVFLLNRGVQRRIALHRAVDHQRRVERSCHDDRLLDALGALGSRGAKIGEGQHGDPWHHAKTASNLGGLDGNFCKRSAVRVHVHGGVSQEDRSPLDVHHVAADDAVSVVRLADEFQIRP